MEHPVGTLEERVTQVGLDDVVAGTSARDAGSASAKPSRGLLVFSSLAPAQPTKVFDTYWHFAAERQAIFFRRLRGMAPPWTTDAILRQHKFTNAYRASESSAQ